MNISVEARERFLERFTQMSNKSIQDCMHELESIEFYAKYHSSSGFELLIQDLRNEPIYKELSENCPEEVISNRINHLLDLPFDNQFENPYDTSLMVYLSLIEDTEEGIRASNRMLNYGNSYNLFWAYALARIIIASVIGVT